MKRYLPAIVIALFSVWIVSTFLPSHSKSEYDLDGFGRLPVLMNGRVKPIDSVARNALLVLQGRQRVKDVAGQTLHPIEWMLDLMTSPEKADKIQVFEITHPDMLAMLGLKAEDGDGKKRFSLEQIKGKTDEILRQAKLASQQESGAQSPFQKAVLYAWTQVISKKITM